eukprot:scaffold2886_cov398-Prasinococcus_capsulatus_cf.AAC.6
MVTVEDKRTSLATKGAQRALQLGLTQGQTSGKDEANTGMDCRAHLVGAVPAVREFPRDFA